MLKILGLAAIALITTGFFGCVHRSGGTWMIKSAPLPEGWPELTPIGDVRVQDYPVYRAATVEQADLEGDGMRPMFMELFNHIKRNEIAMTAPVEMEYTPREGQAPAMASMAFLYRSPTLGAAGEDGEVRVEDLPAASFASVGMRGAYKTSRYERGLAMLDEWAGSQDEWRVVGPARYLGYNSPFVLPFMRYGEVQVPVERAGGSSD